MFQTLLRRSALAAVLSSAVWIRDKGCMGCPVRLVLDRTSLETTWISGVDHVMTSAT